MSRMMAAGARRLAGECARLFGWTPAQFWQTTPAEIAAILSDETAPATAPLSRAECDALLERDRHDR